MAKGREMRVYKVFYRNYGEGKREFLGMLVGGSEDLRGITEIASGLKLAREVYGHLVKDKQSIFVIPCLPELGGSCQSVR